MTSSKALDFNQFLLSSEKKKELTLKEQKLKESCRENLKRSPLRTNLQKRLVWYHIITTTDYLS